MRLPDSVKEAAREAGGVAWGETGSSSKAIDAALKAIEDHPDMYPNNEVIATHQGLKRNIFEGSDG